MTWEQTAAILQKEGMALQKRVDELEAGIQEALKESYKDVGDGKTISEIFDGLESLVSPTIEGGGAAIGGESKIPTCPLCEKKMDARKVFNSEDNLNWVIGVCDSCNVHSPLLYQIDPQKALEAAIMGLHGMAKEFPNPMWKTREDYLAATISEINEILGK